MQGDHKEQNGSHSLNIWKERLALQHRHAEMSTGSKPCILRGILSKGLQALMTRLGPSHDEGPGTQPNIEYDSKWSLQFVYIIYSDSINATTVVQFIQSSYSSYTLHPFVQSVQSKRGQSPTSVIPRKTWFWKESKESNESRGPGIKQLSV